MRYDAPMQLTYDPAEDTDSYLKRTHSEFAALVEKVASADAGGVLAGPRVRVAQRKG